MNKHGCVPIKFNLQKQAVGHIGPTSHSLPTPALNCLEVYTHMHHYKEKQRNYYLKSKLWLPLREAGVTID